MKYKDKIIFKTFIYKNGQIYIYDGKNVNYNRDEALPFSLEIVD